MTDQSTSSGSNGLWREINGDTPRANDHFLILWCREDDSYWWASWQGGMWYGCDELGLRRTSESFTPDLWCEIPRLNGPAQAAPEPVRRMYDSQSGEHYFIDAKGNTYEPAHPSQGGDKDEAVADLIERMELFADHGCSPNVAHD